MIKRETYMNRIRPFIGKDLTGIRRSGKSVMLDLIQNELADQGVSRKQMISFNFENMSNARTDVREETSSDGISPEFKEAMDSYEAFFDEYVEFMKKYAESDDTLGMMEDYADYMTKYADAMEQMNEINEENLSM